ICAMNAREIIKILMADGWKEVRSKGSHRHFSAQDQARDGDCSGSWRARSEETDSRFDYAPSRPGVAGEVGWQSGFTRR
ncbi:MAG TPA: type II toxin-antitoxin system HicA family toxin, partial [Rhodopila sp.]|nr:type II toxin-antitoxin system HicA family toxin [Rhodopila sp.]